MVRCDLRGEVSSFGACLCWVCSTSCCLLTLTLRLVRFVFVTLLLFGELPRKPIVPMFHF